MRRLFVAIGTVALLPAAPACSGNDHYHDSGYYDVPGGGPTNVLRVDIDTDATLESDPGKGAGVFVEYAEGGAYHVFSTCDTDQSGYSCAWEMVASIDPTLSLRFADDGDLEKDDSITRIDDGAVRLSFDSASDFDGALLTVPAGEILRLNVLLDGVYDSSLVSWVSGGSVRTGAPSDPVEFVPTSP